MNVLPVYISYLSSHVQCLSKKKNFLMFLSLSPWTVHANENGDHYLFLQSEQNFLYIHLWQALKKKANHIQIQVFSSWLARIEDHDQINTLSSTWWVKELFTDLDLDTWEAECCNTMEYGCLYILYKCFQMTFQPLNSQFFSFYLDSLCLHVDMYNFIHVHALVTNYILKPCSKNLLLNLEDQN